ncbi:hypothetical protein LEP1GSC037_3963 [Leptospira interrogans str. 2006001854]|uniref:Uncharacterized protein n=1 Tax=Leptospira interrogans str. 2006001854 TaxID=1001590 RepID=M6G985_LEPIR|nr:hypothetical protein LEP1GSC037_3963 [Leptospira interrogans str. 2006001854]
MVLIFLKKLSRFLKCGNSHKLRFYELILLENSFCFLTQNPLKLRTQSEFW